MRTAPIVPILAVMLWACGSSAPTALKPSARPALRVCSVALDSTAFWPVDPAVQLLDGSTARLSAFLKPYRGTECSVVVWASWCPPCTPFAADAMLSVDESTDAWILSAQRYPNAAHARIDPYTQQRFFQLLGIRGIPWTLRFGPASRPIGSTPLLNSLPDAS